MYFLGGIRLLYPRLLDLGLGRMLEKPSDPEIKKITHRDIP